MGSFPRSGRGFHPFAVPRMDVAGRLPAFNLDRHQPLLFFEAFESGFGSGLAQAEIIGDPLRLHHAQRLDGVEHELVMRFGERDVGQLLDVRQHPLAQVIDPLEVVAFADHQFAGVEQILQGNLLFFPVEPTGLLSVGALKIG